MLPSRHPAYFGLTVGSGATTWQELVPNEQNPESVIFLSTPIGTHENNFVWGLFAGYELIPYFALEFAYEHFPDTTIYLAPENIYYDGSNDLTQFTTHSEAVTVSGKYMFYLPHTTIRAYSSVGAAEVHRSDIIVNRWHLSPTFGIGFNYNFTEHGMIEIGFNYIAGYGVSELKPVNDYMPFLYSGFIKLAYRL